MNWGNQNSSGVVNGNLSLTIPFLTTVVNTNATAFWYSLSGVIGLATVSAFIYFFKQTTLVNGITYPSPNMKVKIEGTTTANVNITLLFRNLHLLAVLRQVGDCDFEFGAVGFSWCDTVAQTVFNPVFNATVLAVTFVVPVGTFKIDPTTIGTSTTSTATAFNPQRLVFFCQTRYWGFYSDGTNEVWRTSTDGTTWTSPTTVRAATAGDFFSTWNDCANTKIYYAYANGGTTFFHRAGTLNTAGTITWDYPEVSVSGSHPTEDYPTITKDTSSILWIAFNSFVSGTASHTEVWKCTISGTNCGTSTNWSNSLDAAYGSGLTGTQPASPPAIAPLTSGKLSLVYQSSNALNHLFSVRTYSGTTWNAAAGLTSSYNAAEFATVTISDTTYFAGVRQSATAGNVLFWSCAYPCSSAPTESVLSSATTNSDAVISSNNNLEIVVSYTTASASTSIFYKRSADGGSTFGSEQTLISSESVGGPSTLSITYTKQNNCYEFFWTSNSGFNVRFQCLTTITNFDHTVSVTELLSPTLKQDITTKPSVSETITATLSQALTSTLSTTVSLVAKVRQDLTTLLATTVTLVATLNAIQATVIIIRESIFPFLGAIIILLFVLISILTLILSKKRRDD